MALADFTDLPFLNKNVQDKSTFLGYVEDQSKYFESIDLFVFPSFSEGLGLVLLEAMSYQKICITRNVEPMNQFINNENGYLSVYKHNESLNKEQGDLVKSGEVIATVGSTGELSSGSHLHFELWNNGYPVNPMNFMDFE